jgi:hypothetical protein
MLIYDSNFYDYNSFKCTYANTKQPIILNINIQSLQSKFTNLKNFLLGCINDRIPIDVVSLKKYGKSLTRTTLTYQDLILYISIEKWAGGAELAFIYIAKYHTISLIYPLHLFIRYLKVFHLY